MEDLENFIETSGKSAADYRKQMKPKETRSNVTDTDMKYLLLYLEETYGLTSEKKIETAIGIVAVSYTHLVTTRQAAEHYGIRVNRNGMACCPFHNDKTPSMKLDLSLIHIYF